MKKTVIPLAICILVVSCKLSSTSSQVSSLEFGHASGKPDYCNLLVPPTGGTLFSVWTKIPDDLPSNTSSPVQLRGDMMVYVLNGDGWYIEALVGNIDQFPGYGTDEGYIYNANTMLWINGIYDNDYSYYVTLPADQMSRSKVSDWVWVAWQVVVNADNSMTIRQWLKFGIDGAVFAAGESTVSHAGWTPSDAKTFQVGFDNTYSYTGAVPNSYLCHARMEALGVAPSLDKLNTIACLDAPDPTAWGDWELNWKDNAPNLSDRSGNGHPLSIQAGGALYQGPLIPEFPQ